ncbi:hypothetical protein KA005_31735 [bacterium]|nr:hypothetical protein [bacterium]
MKYALINGNKAEATKKAKGFCPNCGSELIARCGDVNVNHWAHEGNRNCDPWWENETEWHRSWKDKFPLDWQEVSHFDENGEKHIADVKTENNWVLEFQHSYLKPEERRARESFYTKLVWVVNGLKRPTDKLQFQKVLEESTVMCKEPLVQHVHFPEECRLLKEWGNSKSLIFFDFQEPNSTKQYMLWFLYPKISNSKTYVSPFPRNYFIDVHNKNKFDELVENTIIPNCEKLERIRQTQLNNNLYSQLHRLPDVKRQMAIMRRRQKHL